MHTLTSKSNQSDEGDRVLSVEIAAWIEALVAASPSIREVWLFGSRANSAATTTSDWDFLIFSDELTAGEIAGLIRLYRDDVDLLVVTDGDSFESAWGSPVKTGSLSSWHWTRQGTQTATYRSAKWFPAEDTADLPLEVARNLGTVRTSTLQAIRVWPTATSES